MNLPTFCPGKPSTPGNPRFPGAPCATPNITFQTYKKHTTTNLNPKHPSVTY